MKAIPHKQLADLYGVSTRTLSRWIKRFDISRPDNSDRSAHRIYTPKQLKEIYQKIGEPYQDRE